jgi:hypothetical protein
MNIRFNYLYRDAGNYKQYSSVVFNNPNDRDPSEIEQTIRAALIDGEFFDARQWQLPDLRVGEYDDELDHEWHEFESVEETGDDGTQLSIEEFLNRIRQLQRVY